jgi:DNA mismatch repair protein MSH5
VICGISIHDLAIAADGAGLLCGVLKHLLNRGPECPKVLAATHFHDVFREDLLDPDMATISFQHMQVMFTSSDGTSIEGNTSLDLTRLDDVNQDRQFNEHNVRTGEKITYLFR